VTEVKEFAQAIAVNKDVDIVEKETWPGDLSSLEGYFEGVRGDP